MSDHKPPTTFEEWRSSRVPGVGYNAVEAFAAGRASRDAEVETLRARVAELEADAATVFIHHQGECYWSKSTVGTHCPRGSGCQITEPHHHLYSNACPVCRRLIGGGA